MRSVSAIDAHAAAERAAADSAVELRVITAIPDRLTTVSYLVPSRPHHVPRVEYLDSQLNPSPDKPMIQVTGREPVRLDCHLGGTVSLINWEDSYSVRVKRFDDDHKRLFALLNSLHDAMKSGTGGKIVQKVVQELADYTTYHFRGEEALMAETQYPALGAHRLQHREFVKNVEQFQRELKAGAVGQSVAVTSFLKDWLVNHIQRTDREYSTHFNANGWS